MILVLRVGIVGWLRKGMVLDLKLCRDVVTGWSTAKAMIEREHDLASGFEESRDGSGKVRDAQGEHSI